MSDGEGTGKKIAKGAWKQTCNTTAAKTIFSQTAGANHRLAFNMSRTSEVGILTTGARRNWVARLDRPHRGANFNHININPQISGVPDPHLRLSPGAMEAGIGLAKAAKWYGRANKYVLFPAYVATEAYEFGSAIKRDVDNSSSRNIVEKGANFVGTTGTGIAGSYLGAAIGTAIFPGVGTLIGGLCGSVIGTVTGSLATDLAVNEISDAVDYDIVTKYCENCGTKMRFKIYRGEQVQDYCDDCLEDME